MSDDTSIPGMTRAESGALVSTVPNPVPCPKHNRLHTGSGYPEAERINGGVCAGGVRWRWPCGCVLECPPDENTNGLDDDPETA